MRVNTLGRRHEARYDGPDRRKITAYLGKIKHQMIAARQL